MAFKLDLSKFKKVAGDANTTHMQHEDGHTITIQHKGVDAQTKKLLSRLPIHKAEGGSVDDVAEPDPKKAKQVQDSVESTRSPGQMWETLKEGISPKASPKPQHFADGGLAVANSPEDLNRSGPPQAPVTINIGQPQMPAPQALPQQMPQEFQAPPAAPNAASPFDAGNAQAAAYPNGSLPPEAQPSSAPPAPQAAEAPPAAPANVPPPANQPESRGPAANAAPSQMDAYAGNVRGGVEQEIKGLGERMGAEQQLGKAQVGLEQQSLDSAQKQMADYQTAQAAARQSQQQLMNDINNSHLDPNRVWHNKDTGQKIGSVIGMILGGFGAAAGQENLGMKVLQQAIERDIDSQKQDIENKKSLYSYNLQQFRNENDAAAMTRIQLNDIALHKMNIALADNKSPQAKAAYDMAAGEIKQKNALLLSTVGASGASNQAGAGDPIEQQLRVLRLAAPERAKEIESRYVPGVGLASVPLDQKVRDDLAAKQQFGTMAKDFYNWTAQHSGALDPRTQAEGRAKAAEIQSLYRQSIEGGVFKKGEQEFIDKIITSDPTEFFNKFRSLPALKAVVQSNDTKLNLLKRSYGLPAAQGQSAGGYQPKSFKPSK